MTEITVTHVPSPPEEGIHDDLGLTPEQRQAEIDALNQQHQLEEADPASLHIAIGGIEDVRALARDAADARLNAETQGGGFRGLLRRIWKGSIAREYYQQRYHREAEEEIVESGNLYVHQGLDRAASDETLGSVVTRLTHTHIDELTSQDAGEAYARIDNAQDEQAVTIKHEIRDLIDSYCRGDLDDANFEEEKNRRLTMLAQQNPELLGEGLMFADNLLEIAQNVRGMVRHDRGVDAILAEAQIDVGHFKTGVRTEAHFGKTDQLIETIQKTKVGQWLNETTVTTVVSIIASATRFTVQKGVARAAAITGVLGAGGAVIAGARESKHIREDRRQHARERAMGEVFDVNAPRRQELETAQYETVSARVLAENLDALFADSEPGEDGLRKLRELTPEGFLDAMGVIAQIKARNRLSDQRDIDLIHFSHAEDVAEERLTLALTTIYAETALEQFLEEKGGLDWLRQEVGLHENINSLDVIAQLMDRAVVAQIEGDVTAKDEIFKHIHRKHVLKAALIGGTVGIILGAATQEAIAHMPVIGDQLYGIGEGKAPAGARSTMTNGAFNKLSELIHGQPPHSDLTGTITELNPHSKFADVNGYITKQDAQGHWIIEQQSTGKTIGIAYDDKGLLTSESKQNLASLGFRVDETFQTPTLSGVQEHVVIGSNTISLANEYAIKEVSPGNWSILDQHGGVVHALHLNPDGSLTNDSIAELRAGGIGVNDVTSLIESKEPVNLSPDDFVQHHLADTHQVHRTLWYNNNTPNIFDLNELRTYAGGANDSWFDADGNVRLDITPMTPNGSFWANQSANPHALVSEGKLSLAISATKDSQNSVFDFQFTTSPEGRVIATIPPTSPIHQLFAIEDGHRVFKGGYFEVMEHTGVTDPSGEQVKVLGTYVGTNNPGNLTDVITTTRAVHMTSLDIHPAPETIQTIVFNGEIPTEELVEASPVIPIYARRNLEGTINPRTIDPRVRYEYGRYGPQTPEEIDELIADTLPTLLNNPRARVQTAEAVDWYDDLVAERQGEEYVNSIREQINNSPQLSSLDDNTRAVVVMPVAGINEGDNIFEALSLYGQQPEEDQASTQILLNVNWPETAGRTVEAQQKIQHTLAEIERAQQAYPSLRIAVVQSQLTQQQVDKGIIGHVVRRLFDTAILATKKSIDEGRMEPDHEVVIIRNDADAKGISQNYIANMVSAVENDGADAAVGRLRFGIEQTKDLPGLAVALQVLAGVSGSAQRARNKGIDVNIQTSGANTAVRLSTLAAVGSIGFGEDTGAGSDDLSVGSRIKAVRRIASPLHRRLSAERYGSRRLFNWISRTSYTQSTDDSSDDDTIVIANGATIDSDVSRLEGEYRNGRPISAAWNDFDSGGYQARTASLPADQPAESLTKDFDEIVERIQFQINGVFNGWHVDPRHAEMELRRSFPTKQGEEPDYELVTEADGTVNFSFTKKGKETLKKRMTRNNRGQFDPLGSRRLRVNYGTPTRRRSFPAGKTPRLIKAQQV